MGPILLALLLAAPSDSMPAASVTDSVTSTRDSTLAPARRPRELPAAADSTRAKPPAKTDSVLVPAAAAAPAGPVPPVGPVGPIGAPGPVPQGPVLRPGPVVVPSSTVSFGPSGAIVTVDTSSGPHGPSTLAAVGLSLLLPGAGHSWIGSSSSAPAYHALDLLGWAALFISWQYGNAALSSAAELANRYAGASLGSNPDPSLLSAMRSYRSRRPEGGRHGSYDEALVLSGKSTTSQFPDDASHDWDWGSNENPDNNAHLRAFDNQYQRWRTSQVTLYYTVGTLAALRLVAALDVIRLQRASAAKAGVALEIGPTLGGMDARISWAF